jgi:phosphatidate phosphatase PAH1
MLKEEMEYHRPGMLQYVIDTQRKIFSVIYHLADMGEIIIPKDFISSYNFDLAFPPKQDDEELLTRGKAYFLNGEKDKAIADFDEYLRRKRNTANGAGREAIYKLIGVRLEDI